MTDRVMTKERVETLRLGWVLGGVAIAMLPHLQYFAAWIPVAIVAAGAWRLCAARWNRQLPPTWLRVLLVIAGFAGIVSTYGSPTGVDAGTALLTVMLAMKILETRISRDRLIIVFISFFLIFAAVLREQAIWTIGFVVVATFANAAALMQAARIGPPLPPSFALRRAAGTSALAVPVMCLLFLVFPRIPGPFWALPPASGGAVTGLGESMSPGDISRLGTSDAVAMRVRFDGQVPTAPERYWRGPVLTIFDGRTWAAATPPERDYSQADLAGFESSVDVRYDYDVTLEPHNQRWLLALETPNTLPAQSRFTGSLQAIALERISQVHHYTASSIPVSRIRTNEHPKRLAGLTRLPEDYNPRARAWADELMRGNDNPRNYLRAILDSFRENPFYYTLSPAKLGRNSIDEFLFDTRQGFCEHYASAFAVLARMAGIPARVVTGYLGAEHNPLLDYWIVRQSDAHAWVEVRLDNTWVRYDPTAAVAPDRIEIGLDGAITGMELSTGQMLRANRLFNGLVLSWDAVNAAWDRWVLGYGPEIQSAALRWIGFEKPDLRHLAVATGIAMAISLSLTGFLLSRNRRGRPDPVRTAYKRFLRRTAAVSRPKRASEGPSDYSDALAGLRPDLASEVKKITRAYVRLRYEQAPGEEELAAFLRLVRRFRPSSRATA